MKFTDNLEIGDPLEAQAIATVFDPKERDGVPLYVGALKSNIGHLGMLKVIKTCSSWRK